jgi:rRNA maturation endonuclease Nob1
MSIDKEVKAQYKCMKCKKFFPLEEFSLEDKMCLSCKRAGYSARPFFMKKRKAT